MKGFVFTVSDTDSVLRAMNEGGFAVSLRINKKDGKGKRVPATEADFKVKKNGLRSLTVFKSMFASLADFPSVSAGDILFFFAKRNLYGIGRVVGNGSRATFLNYPSALSWPPPLALPNGSVPELGTDPLGRVFVAFEPIGRWLEDGLDMDEALGAPGSDMAQSLRAMAGKSFHQLGHEEALWLATLFLRRVGPQGRFRNISEKQLKANSLRLGQIRDGTLNAFSLHEFVGTAGIDLCDSKGRLRNEDLLHGLLLEELRGPQSENATVLAPPSNELRFLDCFREYWSSPAKQVGYMDRIDVLACFGNAPISEPLYASSPCFYDIYEMKKDARDPSKDPIDQVLQGMKYVDFLSRRVTAGNYEAIRLTTILAEPETKAELAYQDELLKALKDTAHRTFTIGVRQTGTSPNRPWSAARLMTYRWDSVKRALRLKLIV